MSTVAIRKVHKSYGALPVIHGVSIDISDGEFVALVGPSGCGKSTLLRMIAGLEDITGGDIVIAERVVNDIAPKDRDIAMVFQNYALYPHMNVRQNMGFALRQRKIPRNEIDWRVMNAARILGLELLLDRKRALFPAVSASASPWDGPSCATPTFSSSMNRYPTSTRSCACRCARNSRNCTSALASPRSMSRTIRSKR